MGLVVQTQDGQKWLQKQADVLACLCHRFKANAIQTPTRGDAPVDALLVRHNEVVAVVEIKCRQFSLDTLREYGDGLVTASKVQDGIHTGALLRVPFIVVFGLPDGSVVYWHISDKHGVKQFHWLEKHTPTKATSQTDAVVHRNNAFLPVSKMKVLYANNVA